MQRRGHQRRQPLVALPHVARLHRHINLETARKTQHPRFHSRKSCTARLTCLASVISIRTPPGPCTMIPAVPDGADSATGPFFATTASSQRTGFFLFGLPFGGEAWPVSLRRFCTQLAHVGYLIPAHAANFCPLIPLRSNSASSASRLCRGVFTRPITSFFNIPSSSPVVDVIDFLCYDTYDPLNQWCYTGRLRINLRFFLSMEPARSEYFSESEKVISPFAYSEVAISRNKGSGGKFFLIIGLSLGCTS